MPFNAVNEFSLRRSKLSKEELDALAYTSLSTSPEDILIIDPDEEYAKLAPETRGETAVADKAITDFGKPLSVSLYTDGACSGNPGAGGYGYAVVVKDVLVLNGSGGLLATTNNQMELTAVIEGLKVIPEKFSVVVYSDSSYVVNAFNKGWVSGWKKRKWMKSNNEPVANRDLWEALLAVIELHPSVRFVWVKGHAGNKYNELCDKLAVKALKDLK